MKTPGGKMWMKENHFHPQCWLDRGIAEIESRPVVETRGRRRLTMTDDVRKERLRLMGQRASVMQRLRAEQDKPKPNFTKIEKLCMYIESIKDKIKDFGGVPKSWEMDDEEVKV